MANTFPTPSNATGILELYRGTAVTLAAGTNIVNFNGQSYSDSILYLATPQNSPGRITFSPVTLSRGISMSLSASFDSGAAEDVTVQIIQNPDGVPVVIASGSATIPVIGDVASVSLQALVGISSGSPAGDRTFAVRIINTGNVELGSVNPARCISWMVKVD